MGEERWAGSERASVEEREGAGGEDMEARGPVLDGTLWRDEGDSNTDMNDSNTECLR